MQRIKVFKYSEGVWIMKMKKQEELAESYLSQLNDALRPLYRDLIEYLSALGYNPKKEKSALSFKHGLHNKQMAKMGTRPGKNQEPIPYFSLRFSACRLYSQRFADIIRRNIDKHPGKVPGCINGECHFCAGEPSAHTHFRTAKASHIAAHMRLKSRI